LIGDCAQKLGIGRQIAHPAKSGIGAMTLDGFVFTPKSNKEPTPEERAERARAKIDRSLDDIVAENRLEESRNRGEKRRDRRDGDWRRDRTPNRGDDKRYVKLDLSEHEVQQILRMADIDTGGYRVQLRLAMWRPDQRKSTH
jgi:hypothetical protein